MMSEYAEGFKEGLGEDSSAAASEASHGAAGEVEQRFQMPQGYQSLQRWFTESRDGVAAKKRPAPSSEEVLPPRAMTSRPSATATVAPHSRDLPAPHRPLPEPAPLPVQREAENPSEERPPAASDTLPRLSAVTSGEEKKPPAAKETQ